MDDFDNACSAYEKALELEEDHVFHLNYAITLFNNEEVHSLIPKVLSDVANLRWSVHKHISSNSKGSSVSSTLQ